MMVYSDLYQQAIEKYGKDHQLVVTFGEMAECTAEIAKHIIPDRKHNEQDLINELADVSIMLSQMEIAYGDKLYKAIQKKLKKLEKHIKEDAYEQE